MVSMLATVAAMDRDLLVVRTQAGLPRARAEGRTLGRPRKTTQVQRAAMNYAQQRGSSVSAPDEQGAAFQGAFSCPTRFRTPCASAPRPDQTTQN
jgi:DNA invertase Pin-like site-specific DNA recombinase